MVISTTSIKGVEEAKNVSPIKQASAWPFFGALLLTIGLVYFVSIKAEDYFDI